MAENKWGETEVLLTPDLEVVEGPYSRQQQIYFGVSSDLAHPDFQFPMKFDPS